MKRISWFVGLVLALGPGMVAAADDGVNIVELPGLGKASRATWMNDSGWVIGYSTSDSSPIGAVDTPFVYRPGLGMRKLTYGTDTLAVEVINNEGVVAGETSVQYLGKPFIWTSAHGFIINNNMPSGWFYPTITGINSGGIVAGWSFNEYGSSRPFRWNPAGGTEALTVPYGTSQAYAWGINHGGQVSGWFNNNSGNHAVVWEAEGQMTRVGPPPGTDGDYNVMALGINDNGLVAGVWYPSSGPSLFVWSRPKGFRNIGLLPGGVGLASHRLSINNMGQIAGNLFDADYNCISFIWDPVIGYRTPDSIGAQFLPNYIIGNLNNLGQVCGESVNGYAATAGGGTMTELGALGGNSSQGWYLNDRGMVAGAMTGVLGAQQPFVWDGASMLGIGVPVQYAHVTGLNNSGSVLLNYYSSSWIWDSVHGLSTVLGPGGEDVYAADINDRGQAVGLTTTYTKSPTIFLYDPTLGTLDLGNLGGYPYRIAGMNNNAQIIGNAEVDGWVSTAFVYDSRTNMTTQLNEPDYPYVTLKPNSINDKGQVACDWGVYNFGYLYDPTTGVTALTADPTIWGSAPLKINAFGQIVGYAYLFADLQNQIGAITNSNVWMDLNDVVNPALKWVISNAASINKNGQITGYGYHQGKYRAFLMTPKAKIKSFTLAASAVKGGSSTTGTITLSQAAPYDLFVELKSDTSKAAVPEFVALRKGATSATITVNTTSVTALMTAHISASFANTSFVRSLQVKK